MVAWKLMATLEATMRPPRPFPAGASERLAVLLKTARQKEHYQRVQCCWLRAAFSLPAEHIARTIGWSVQTVYQVHSTYSRGGEAALEPHPEGGRRRANLSLAEEKALLAGFVAEAEAGGLLEVGAIVTAYEKAVGHHVPPSTVYRMLKRHDWRTIAPRPRHPKNDPIRAEEFKKNWGPPLRNT
jgi:transposase